MLGNGDVPNGQKHKHEDHQNHEAWAIPYGDLVTLLLAFFVVMYAISSVNEGKYRVLSDSLQAAFRGAPKTLDPVQVGEKTPRQRRGHRRVDRAAGEHRRPAAADARGDFRRPGKDGKGLGPSRDDGSRRRPQQGRSRRCRPSSRKWRTKSRSRWPRSSTRELVTVRRHSYWIEVEIRADILFPSGVATISPSAVPALQALAKALAPYPNPVRVEGHTDNVPIKTVAFPSNWELSSARAATRRAPAREWRRRAEAPVGHRPRRMAPDRSQRHRRRPQCQSPRVARDPLRRRRSPDGNARAAARHRPRRSPRRICADARSNRPHPCPLPAAAPRAAARGREFAARCDAAHEL